MTTQLFSSGGTCEPSASPGDRRSETQRANGSRLQAVDPERVATDRLRADYGEFVKPRVAQLLGAVDLDVVYHRAEGDYLFYYDLAGNEQRVLDLLGGFGASLFGHAAPALVGCLQRQLAVKRPFNAQASVRGVAGPLARRLSELVGRSTGQSYITTFCSSGAEAVEAALKHAEMEAWERRTRLIDDNRRIASRARHAVSEGRNPFAEQLPLGEAVSPKAVGALLDDLLARLKSELSRPAAVFALGGAFHGKTSGALRLTHSAAYRRPWERWGHATFLPPEDLPALERALAEHEALLTVLSEDEFGKVRIETRPFCNVAALFCEPLQGEGGVRELSAAYLTELRRAADLHGFPLVLDEIQSGMGRTGRFLASEWTGVRGDYYLLSKSLGGGLVKIAALMIDRRRYEHEFGFLHTSTFAEDDHACAVALAALDALEAGDGAVLRACGSKGEHLLGGFRALAAEFPDQVEEVRGRGLMVGIALRSQRRSPSTLLRVLSEQRLLSFFLAGYLLREHGIRVAPALSDHGTIRVEPSAEIELGELDRFVSALRRTLELLRAADVAGLCGVPGAVEVRARPPATTSTYDRAQPALRRRVGFLAHLRDASDLRIIEPRMSQLSDAQCDDMMARVTRVLEPFVLGEDTIRSTLGVSVELSVIAVPFTAAQALSALRGQGMAWVSDQVRAAVALAAEQGASIVGCGGYTSIVSNNCQELITEGFGVTSGNSLTASAAVDALFRAAERTAVAGRVLGVVGAVGNIGAMLSELAAERAERVILVGRPGAATRLERVAARLNCPASVTTDLRALRECSLIVSATNSPVPIILPEHLGTHPIVICDAAVPSDVSPAVAAARPNALVLRGGAVRLPFGQELRIGGVSVSPGSVYACLAETLLLGLSDARGNFSYGPLQSSKVRLIRGLAEDHGFVVEENRSLGRKAWRGLDD